MHELKRLRLCPLPEGRRTFGHGILAAAVSASDVLDQDLQVDFLSVTIGKAYERQDKSESVLCLDGMARATKQ